MFDTNNGASVSIDGQSGGVTIVGRKTSVASTLTVQSLECAGNIVVLPDGTVDAQFLSGIISDTSVLPPIPCSKLFGQLSTSSFAPNSIPVGAVIGLYDPFQSTLSNIAFSNQTSAASLFLDRNGRINVSSTAAKVLGGLQVSGPTIMDGTVTFNSNVLGVGPAIKAFFSDASNVVSKIALGSNVTLTAGLSTGQLLVNGSPIQSTSIAYAANSIPQQAISNLLTSLQTQSITLSNPAATVSMTPVGANQLNVSSAIAATGGFVGPLSGVATSARGLVGTPDVSVGTLTVAGSNIGFSNGVFAIAGSPLPSSSIAFKPATVPNASLQAPNPWSVTAGSTVVYTHSNVSIGSSTMDASQFSLQVKGAICAETDLVVVSDARLKARLEQIPDALAKIKKISGFTYDRLDTVPDRRYAGVLAQDVEAVLPEAVYETTATNNGIDDEQEGGIGGKQSDYKAVAYASLVALVVQAIKELDEKVDRYIIASTTATATV